MNAVVIGGKKQKLELEQFLGEHRVNTCLLNEGHAKSDLA